MSSAIEDIRDALVAETSVTDLVGTRIYPNVAPQGTAPGPFVVLTVVSDLPYNSLNGTATGRLSEVHLQVDTYGSTYLGARAAADAVDAVISALSSPDLSAIRESGNESWEDETGLHRIGAEYTVWR